MKAWLPRRAVGLLFAALMGIAFANQKVPDRAEDIEPLPVGTVAPDFSAEAADGERFEFDPTGLSQPTVLIFYRGGWCPYCNKHLQSLRTAVPKLAEHGYEVLFLSADRPEILRTSLEEQIPEYRLLSDSSLEVARRFGVAFRVDDATVAKYRNFGIDLEQASGYDHQQLPVPAVFLIGTDGRIRFVYADPDYKVRLSAKELLDAAGIDS